MGVIRSHDDATSRKVVTRTNDLITPVMRVFTCHWPCCGSVHIDVTRVCIDNNCMESDTECESTDKGNITGHPKLFHY